MTNDANPSPPEDDDVEIVDALVVLEPAERTLPAPVRAVADLVLATPARQVATLAASGFVAGAATVALVHRRQSRGAARRLVRAQASRRPVLGEVVHSSSFLVDVHLLRRD